MNRYKLIAVVTIITLISCKKEHTDNVEITPCDVNESYFDGFEVVSTLNGQTNVSNASVTVSHESFVPVIGEHFPGYDILINLYDSQQRSVGTRGTQIHMAYKNKNIPITPLLQDKDYFYTISLIKKLNLDDMFCIQHPYEAVEITLPEINRFKTRKAKYPIGLVTDHEGNVYETVTVGSQEWFVQNLRSNRYSDGDTIPHSGHYRFDKTYPYVVTHRGRLYVGKSMLTGKNPCPKGWHVPTETEFEDLLTTLRQLYGNGYPNEIYFNTNNETYLSFAYSMYEGGRYLTQTAKNDSVIYAYQSNYRNKTMERIEVTTNPSDIPLMVYDSQACIRCIRD